MKVKLAAVALVLLMLVAAWRLEIFAHVGDPRALARTLVDMGGRGYLAFIVAYTVLQRFGVPGTVFVVGAPLIWRWPTAFALSMVGTMAASVVGFAFARFIARDWVSARIPARLRKYDEAVARSAFQTVVVLRLILWMPQVLHASSACRRWARRAGPSPESATRGSPPAAEASRSAARGQ